MNPFQRGLVKEVVRRVRHNPSKRIIGLTGPRQTGKTTIALQACQLLDEAGYAIEFKSLDTTAEPSADDWSGRVAIESIPVEATPTAQWLTETWSRAREQAFREVHGMVLILDEIQRISGWSNVVKGLWDQDRRIQCPLQVLVLGSAPWKMLTGLNESLAGRFLSIRVTHWSLLEVASAFNRTLNEYLFYGGYPGALQDNPAYPFHGEWRDYIVHAIVSPAVNRDVVALSRIRKPALMRQLVDLAPQYSGQIMAFNKLLGQMHDAGNTTTLAEYLRLLSDTGLIIGLSQYSSAPHLGRSRPPKLNVLNTALMTAPSGYTFEQAKNDRTFWGRLTESAVGAHLCNTRETSTRVHYWRNKKGSEIDFVVVRGPSVLGIEVKSGRLRKLSGLSAFRERFPAAEAIVVGTGGIPLNEFLSVGIEQWLDEKC